MARNCTGRKGEDCFVPVPLGTLVSDADTGELIGDLTKAGETLLVAKGGFHGLGNTRFKSSINRAPQKPVKARKATPDAQSGINGNRRCRAVGYAQCRKIQLDTRGFIRYA